MDGKGRELHDQMKLPSVDSSQLPLAVSASVLERSTGACLSVLAEPLLPKGREERCEQCGTKGRIKCGLNLTDSGIGAGPTWEGERLAGRDISNGDIKEEF